MAYRYLLCVEGKGKEMQEAKLSRYIEYVYLSKTYFTFYLGICRGNSNHSLIC